MQDLFRILRFTSELKRYYIGIGFVTVILSAMQMVQPIITGTIIDTLKSGTNTEVNKVVILIFILFLEDGGASVLNNINGYLGDQMGSRLHKILGEKYYAHILGLPQAYFDNQLSGKIISMLNRGAQQISAFINMFANNFLQFLLSTIFSLGVAAYYSWPVAAVLALLYPIFIVMTIKTSNKWQKLQSKRNEAIDTALGRFTETVGQHKVTKSFLAESRELNFYRKYMKRFVDIGRPQSAYWHKKDVERRIVLALVFLGVYLLIFIQAANGTITTGEAVTLMLVAFQIRIPIFSISFLVDNTQRAIADSKDYFKVLNVQKEVEQENAKQLIISRGKIEFSKINFGYNDDSKVLKGVSFKLEPDKKMALVGESGEGKTTITNLLLRLYRPQSGKILIDDQDISGVTIDSLRGSIGVVFQEPALFSGTIRENIAYSRPDATDEEIKSAASAANAHEFIEKLEKGYDSEIGERGLKLSGGQKQRIAIARALLKDAPILILDEATSSLDNKSEILVQEALVRLMKGRSTIIIAHRLSTIQNVDVIVTLKNGKVDEIGSPQQLAKSSGIYATLLSLGQKNELRHSEETTESLKVYDIVDSN